VKGEKYMNQEKIGNFIAKCRKDKKMTQSELAEKLGVTDKSIGNWENGRNMPDLSLFKPLCDELGITINDLLSGEKIIKDKYQEKFEENIVNTIDYSTKKIHKYSNVIGLLLIIFGLFVSLSAIMIFPSESSWGSIYSVFGVVIFVIGISKLTRDIKIGYRLLLILAIFLGTIGVLFFTDYINVKMNNQAPMFRVTTTYLGGEEELLYYDTPLYDAIKCNGKFNIVKNKNYSHEELFNYCANQKAD
jgi:transcriptional regulator with XRE-family HTH domain